MKRKNSLTGVLLGVLWLAGCGGAALPEVPDWVPETSPTLRISSTPTPKPEEWIPETTPTVVISSTPTPKPEEWIPEATPTVAVSSTPTPKPESFYSLEELYAASENPDGRRLADMLWESQREAGLYDCSAEKLEEKNMLTYYVSSSEGDDKNSGKTPEQPKKTLAAFSGISNVNVLLKCGDTFSMTDTFRVGSNVILAAYGEGPRPVLDYYQPLKAVWTQVNSAENVWVADLTGVTGLYLGKGDIKDCNIGQLLIDGECNWKRLVRGSEERYSYPECLAERKDGGFAVEWTEAKLYLYSEENPNRLEIYYALPQHALSIENARGSEVLGIEIRGSGFHGISLSEVSELTICNCYIHHIGGGILSNGSVRYGNAVELWNTGKEVTVMYNMAEWIFDACFTNQGSDTGMLQQAVTFAKNLGRYSFWGIETWGDGNSVNEFADVVYADNILMFACDVTNADQAVYVNEKEETMDENGDYYSDYPAYHTYRGSASDYPYNQMALLNAANAKTKEALRISDNLFWGTNRFLTLLKMTKENRLGFVLENNIFYAELPSEAFVFRYTDVQNRRILKKEPEEHNASLCVIKGTDAAEDREAARSVLLQKLGMVAFGTE